MKRIGAILVVVALVAIVVVAFVSITGPLTGKVFSTISASLGSSSGGGYAYDSIAPSPEEFHTARDISLPQTSVANQNQSDYFSADPQRMVIKNADLTIVVKDPLAKMKEISTLAADLGGYVVSSSTSQSYVSDNVKVPEGAMAIRVPAEKLNAALEKIKADVVEVQNDTQTGQDVTKEYTDLGSQLKNLQATEKKLTEIMDKAEKTEDVLAVFNQLTQIRGQIEVITGQMKYYEQSAAMSSISVRILAEKTIQPIKIAGWQPEGQARDAAQALVNFFQNFVNFLIWLVIFFLPVALVLLGLVFLLWRLGSWIMKKFGSKKAASAE